jgi:ferredoxin
MAVIYYFSATGNSYDVAREIADKLGGARLLSLVPLMSHTCEEPVVGIVFPVYDWSLPPVVKDFLMGLDVSKAQYIFAVATCNFLPGYALDKVDRLLRDKGKGLNAGFFIRMPGTYLPMYGANSPRTQARKLAAKSKKTDRIARIVRDRRRHRIEHSLLLFDRLLAPKMERHIEHFADMDGQFVVETGCTGCGICAQVCPFDNIEIVDQIPRWRHHCQQCLACVHFCPNECIQIGDKTRGKKRYRNPAVPLKEIIRLAAEGKGLSP